MGKDFEKKGQKKKRHAFLFNPASTTRANRRSVPPPSSMLVKNLSFAADFVLHSGRFFEKTLFTAFTRRLMRSEIYR